MENKKGYEYHKILMDAKAISTTYPDKSFAMCKEVYDLSMKNKLKLEEANALIGMSLACRAKSETSKMLDYSFSALEIFEVLQVHLGQVKSLNLIGIAYFYSSMYEEAYKYLLQALTLSDEVKDDSLVGSILNNIGEVFRESGSYDKALDYYQQALRISTGINSKINTATILNNIGEVYFFNNNYHEAFENFTQSYNLLLKENEMVLLGEVETKLGKVFLINKNYSEAEKYFFSALKKLDDLDNKFYAIDVLVNIAKLESKKTPNKFVFYLEQAIQYAEEIEANKKLSEVYKILSDYYERIENWEYSLEYFKKYHGIEQEVATAIVGSKLEILKIELNHLNENHELKNIKRLNLRLETEILKQKREISKIHKQNKTLEKKALEDELTGVPNRSYINDQLKENWEEILLANQTVCLFILDIDNFKKYNDYWGHLEGDECLKKVATCIKNIQLERGDMFARYGGEEFIYYAIGLRYNHALELGNLIRMEVEKLRLKYTLDDQSSVVTISVGGVLGRPSNLNNIPDMLQLADNELYRAKNTGRNRTFLNSLIEE